MEVKTKLMEMNECDFLKDRKLLVKCLVVLSAVIVGFLLHGLLHYESATVAIAGATVLLFISGLKTEKIFHEIEWKTIFFFAGLFILVGGIKETGVINLMAQGVLKITGGDVVFATLSILWLSAVASAFIDNIPFTATMIPLIKDLGAISGMNVMPLWWALSLGACLGGNGTIIGASANVIAAGIAEEHGHKISFMQYFKIAFPLTILTIVISSLYLYLLYLS